MPLKNKYSRKKNKYNHKKSLRKKYSRKKSLRKKYSRKKNLRRKYSRKKSLRKNKRKINYSINKNLLSGGCCFSKPTKIDNPKRGKEQMEASASASILPRGATVYRHKVIGICGSHRTEPALAPPPAPAPPPARLQHQHGSSTSSTTSTAFHHQHQLQLQLQLHHQHQHQLQLPAPAPEISSKRIKQLRLHFVLDLKFYLYPEKRT